MDTDHNHLMPARITVSATSTTPCSEDDDPSKVEKPSYTPSAWSCNGTATATLLVKNTFLHYDMGAQPDAFGQKSVSGPAYFSHVGRELTKAANRLVGNSHNKNEDDSPLVGPRDRRVVHFVEETLAASVSEATCEMAPAPPDADMLHELPSIGSADHATGQCRPCAHSWREGGCAKGWSCTFCHLCGVEALKQKKRDKVARIRDERRQQKTTDSAAGQLAAREAKLCFETRRKGLAAGELQVVCAGDRDESIEISWAVDLRRLRQQNRCGIIRRFPLRIQGFEAPFLLTVVPSGAASFSATDVELFAGIQLKCVEPTVLPVGSCRVAITTKFGDAPPRQAASAHDFAVDTTCRLAAALDLAAAACAAACVVKISLTPS
jgi:hypothetical protein